VEKLLDFSGVDFFFSGRSGLLALLAFFGFGFGLHALCGRGRVSNACSSSGLGSSKLRVGLVVQGDVLEERLACFVGGVHTFVGCTTGAADSNQEFLLHRVGNLG
jgi:hypothetical protein